MEPQTSVNTLKCQSSQQPIITITEPHLNCKSLPPILDISFSSYLKQKESLNLPPKIDDSEINVFDAHKYFNEPNETTIDKPLSLPNHRQNNVDARDVSTIPCRLSAVSSADGCERNYKTTSFRATPTASSEASWNSRRGLLSNRPGWVKNLVTDKHGKKKSSTSRWAFCRKCPCSGKKSVRVEEPSTENRTPEAKIKNSSPKTKQSETRPEKISIIPQDPSILSKMAPERQQRIVSNTITLSAERFQAPRNSQQQCVSVLKRSFGDGPTSFSFPVLAPSFPPKPVQKHPVTPGEEPGRFSLDVFQPKTEPIRKESMEIQAQTDDDIESDASSDLFEIESFATGHRRDSLDDAARFSSGKCPGSKFDSPLDEITECYAPSEVSVDWSVTTAEGFDRKSVGNYSMSVSEICQLSRLRNTIEDGNEFGKKKGMGLLSCRHENSVSVGQRKIKCVPEGHCYL